MPRVFRHAFTALSLLSLLLCVGVCVLWVRSYWRYDRWLLPTTGRYTSASSWEGEIRISHVPTRGRDLITSLAQAKWGRWGGFGFFRGPINIDEPRHADEPQWIRGGGPAGDGFAVAVPYWSVAACAVLPGLIRLIRAVRQWRRARSGYCVACGYDLRASPGRCPECGAGVQQEPAI